LASTLELDRGSHACSVGRRIPSNERKIRRTAIMERDCVSFRSVRKSFLTAPVGTKY
jgi:hypothetical protein